MQWACEICRYVHDAENAPGICPVCGAPESRFSVWAGDEIGFLDSDIESETDSFEKDLFGDYEE